MENAELLALLVAALLCGFSGILGVFRGARSMNVPIILLASINLMLSGYCSASFAARLLGDA